MILTDWVKFWAKNLQITTQALEANVLSEFDEKDETFFTGTDATLNLYALGIKQELCVEKVPNEKRELLDFKTDSAKDFRVKCEKFELLDSFAGCRQLKELTVELLDERGGTFALLNEKVFISLHKDLNKPPRISNDSKFSNNLLYFGVR